MTALLVVASLQLFLFVIVCGLILRELRRARLEAHVRGDVGHELLEEQMDELRELETIEATVRHELRKLIEVQ